MEKFLKSSEEEMILTALQADPALKACILEMIGIAEAELGTLDRGDDAEEAVVEVMHKTSKTILQKWAEKKGSEAHHMMKSPWNRLHRKKN